MPPDVRGLTVLVVDDDEVAADAAVKPADRISEADLRSGCVRFPSLFKTALLSGEGRHHGRGLERHARIPAAGLARARAQLPVFDRLRGEIGDDAQAIAHEVCETMNPDPGERG